jgi:hypothetical protein
MACKEDNEEIRQALGKAEERLAEDQEQPYVRLKSPDLFAYLDFRNLRDIIEAFWDDFKDGIPRKKVFLGMLETLEIIRNAVAHNRPVSAQALVEVRKAREVVGNVVGRSGTV